VGDGAWAIRDGQGGGLGDGVGNAGMRELSCEWAEGGKRSNDLSDPDWLGQVVGWDESGTGASNHESGSSGELHFD